MYVLRNAFEVSVLGIPQSSQIRGEPVAARLRREAQVGLDSWSLIGDDLLELADELVARDAKKPKQVSLRRAVSCAYYAEFHNAHIQLRAANPPVRLQCVVGWPAPAQSGGQERRQVCRLNRPGSEFLKKTIQRSELDSGRV